jgi:hypothetical protein
MDKKSWLTSADPHAMLEFLGNQASERKLRLFACACCRRVWHLLTDERSRSAVEAAELHAEGALDDAALTSAWLIASETERPAFAKKNCAPSRTIASTAVCATLPDPFRAARECLLTVNWVNRGPLRDENDWQRSVLRDIFGNPFQPFVVSNDWLVWNHGAIDALARSAYSHCIFPAGTLEPDRLAVLADALEEVGCSDEAALDHLRGPGPHYRGCHVLEALLGQK